MDRTTNLTRVERLHVLSAMLNYLKQAENMAPIVTRNGGRSSVPEIHSAIRKLGGDPRLPGIGIELIP